ncbi:MAG: ABC transporter permease [Bacteroidales bacterium]|nr:ABC transporter permease [Bacteroidales bacterium]
MTSIKLALRNIFKNRLSFMIGFISLLVGFTVSLLIGIYLYNELNYDRFHEKENIYRVGFSANFANTCTNYAFAWAPLGPKMKEYYPEIVDFVRLYKIPSKIIVNHNENKFLQEDLFYVDQNLFEFFSFELSTGNPRTALSEPNTAVLTEQMAKLYFGNQNPIGKIIEADDKEFIVTGIAKSPPINSHIKFNILFSISSKQEDKIGNEKVLESWKLINYYTYLHLSNKESIKSINSNKQAFIDKELYIFKKDLNVDIGLIIQPLKDIHLHSNLDRELELNNSASNLWIVFIIALFVFIISCVNFILISTNINITRFKEVYIKKVLGQSKISIIISYLFETLFVCFVSLLFALLLFYYLLPQYNLISHSEFSFDYLLNWQIIIGIISVLLFTGIVPGYFSGKILFAFKLNSTKESPSSLQVFNSSTILIVQFCIAFTLIICSLIFNKQLEFIQNHNLGYDKSNILIIRTNDREIRNSAENICEKIMTFPEVVSASVSSNNFANEPSTFAISLTNNGENKEVQTNYNSVDYNFKDTYGFNLVKGRFFSRDFPTDSFGVVVNKTFCKELNLIAPINKNVYFLGREYKIIGVLEDFHFSSFREKIEPYLMFFKMSGTRNRYINIKLQDQLSQQIIKKIEEIWSDTFPDNIFEYTIYENALQKRYQNDLVLVKLLKYLSIIVIIIALSGLLGQNFLMLRLRRKEIAIRKVLGANFKDLLYTLTKKYAILLLISWLVASCISYFLTQEWLNNFVFRFENQYVYFIIPIILSILISLLIISLKTLKSLNENPIESLKEE